MRLFFPGEPLSGADTLDRGIDQQSQEHHHSGQDGSHEIQGAHFHLHHLVGDVDILSFDEVIAAPS